VGGTSSTTRAGGHVLAAALALATAGAVSPARAQSNYKLSPVGGRTTLVGGTGLAYGRDGASMFLNPATATRVDDAGLAFSVNFYTMSLVYAPRWYQPGPVDTARFGAIDAGSASMTDLEFNALPSSLCFFFGVGDIAFLSARAARAAEEKRAREGKLGLCFASIRGQSFNFAADSYDHTAATGSVTRHAQTLSQSYDRFAAGPTYAMNITERLAVGVSTHISFATHRNILAAATSTYGAGVPAPVTSTFYNGARGDALQLTATAGATYRFGVPSVAVAVESPSLHLFGVGAANLATHFEAAGTASSTTAVSGSFKSQSPLRISGGFGLEDRWGSAELNVSWFAPQSAAYSAELEGRTLDRVNGGAINDQVTKVALSERSDGVVNVGAGAQIFVLPTVSLLGGASTDLSAVPGDGPKGTLLNYYPARSHRVTASFGIGSHGDGGDLLFGLEASVAWGERLAVNSYQLPPVIGSTTHETFGLLFVIAGSTSFKSIQRAVRDVRDVIKD